MDRLFTRFAILTSSWKFDTIEGRLPVISRW